MSAPDFKTYVIESADFMLNQQTFRGETVTAVHEISGKLYLFTPNHTYICRRRRWYERLWRKLRGGA